jgi:hypothetical protein
MLHLRRWSRKKRKKKNQPWRCSRSVFISSLKLHTKSFPIDGVYSLLLVVSLIGITSRGLLLEWITIVILLD